MSAVLVADTMSKGQRIQFYDRIAARALSQRPERVGTCDRCGCARYADIEGCLGCIELRKLGVEIKASVARRASMDKPKREAARPEPTEYRVLAWIKRFTAERGYSPTWQEIGDGMGLTQLALMPLVKKLIADGQIHRTRAKRRMLALGPPRLDCIPENDLRAELNRRSHR